MNATRLFLLSCLASAVLLTPHTTAAAAAPYAVFKIYEAAVNAGDIGAVTALLAKDIARPPHARCAASLSDHDCAVDYLNETTVKRHSVLSDEAVSVQGDVVMAKVELRNDATRAAGIERLSGMDRLRVRDGKIVEFAFLRDETDAQTMKFFQFMMSHGGPPPAH